MSGCGHPRIGGLCMVGLVHVSRLRESASQHQPASASIDEHLPSILIGQREARMRLMASERVATDVRN